MDIKLTIEGESFAKYLRLYIGFPYQITRGIRIILLKLIVESIHISKEVIMLIAQYIKVSFLYDF